MTEYPGAIDKLALAELEAAYPWIHWRKSVMINGRFACRICIARVGLKGTDVDKLPLTVDGFNAHFAEAHGDPAQEYVER